MDEEKHRAYIGVSNRLILENMAVVLKSEKPVLVRMPLIPTVNDDLENLDATGAFLSAHRTAVRMELLPYHRLGESKYARLGRSYDMDGIEPPGDDWMNRSKEIMEKFDIRIVKT
jgi:pyruvate formate lyase activating enzyme